MSVKKQDSQSLPNDEATTRPDAGRQGEIADTQLDQVSGGALRRTGDEDLEDLEIQR